MLSKESQQNQENSEDKKTREILSSPTKTLEWAWNNAFNSRTSALRHIKVNTEIPWYKQQLRLITPTNLDEWLTKSNQLLEKPSDLVFVDLQGGDIGCKEISMTDRLVAVEGEIPPILKYSVIDAIALNPFEYRQIDTRNLPSEHKSGNAQRPLHINLMQLYRDSARKLKSALGALQEERFGYMKDPSKRNDVFKNNTERALKKRLHQPTLELELTSRVAAYSEKSKDVDPRNLMGIRLTFTNAYLRVAKFYPYVTTMKRERFPGEFQPYEEQVGVFMLSKYPQVNTLFDEFDFKLDNFENEIKSKISGKKSR
jgi:hypothetical protein